MFVYLLKCELENADLQASDLRSKMAEFNHIALMEDTWMFKTDLDIEKVDAILADSLEEISKVMIMEVKGDFTMQGLSEEHMSWIEENLNEGGEIEEE